jgi:protoporphyrinogen oxidase
VEITILGAGISGMSAAYHANKMNISYQVYERKKRYGGLLRSIEKKGYTFDRCTHLSFTKDVYVKSLFSKTEFFTYNSKPNSIKDNIWYPYPITDHLNRLSLYNKIKIIFNYIFRKRFKSATNYHEWLLDQYGSMITNDYFLQYTIKYWRREPKDLDVDWVAKRLPSFDIYKLFKSIIGIQKKSSYYINELRYPKKGGFISFLNFSLKNKVNYNYEVKGISLKNKTITFKNGERKDYEKVVSSIPLPEYINYIDDLPQHIIFKLKKLYWTSVALVSIGYKIYDNLHENDAIWFYIYDKKYKASRAYFTHKKSQHNSPRGFGGIQFEIYFDWNSKNQINKLALSDNCIKFCKEHNIIGDDHEVLSYNVVKYGNIIMDNERKTHVKDIRDYLESCDIHTIGRFGEWDYLWSDGSLISGKNKIEEIYQV